MQQTTRIAYFDCFSGISGDMTLGALVDAGLPLDALAEGLRAGLPALDSYRLEAERASQHGIGGTRVNVALDPDRPQPQRDWRDIRALLEASALPAPAREMALRVFAALARAEAHVHGTSVEDVHFHEVGAVDSIVDIAGAALGLHLLGIARVYCSPLSDGRGFTRSQHGVIPIPAPATAALLTAAGAPTREAPTDRELVTPTGAAIVAALAEFHRPEFRPTAVGYGYGKRELPWPNALRLWIGETRNAERGTRNIERGVSGGGDEPVGTAATLTEGIPHSDTRKRVPGVPHSLADPLDDREAERDEAVLLETNIDDMNPQFYAPLLDRLFAAGALDAFLTPIVMKKGRPAIKVSVLATPVGAAALTALLIGETTTLGVRATPVTRTKAGRAFATVQTPWGEARVKLKCWQGRVVAAMPEYDDCAALATATGLPVATVHHAVARLGEAFVEGEEGEIAAPDRPGGEK